MIACPVFFNKRSGRGELPRMTRKFTTDQEISTMCNHICLSVSKRDKFINAIKENGYECIILKREMSDLVFIKDKSGNLFEIKEEEK